MKKIIFISALFFGSCSTEKIITKWNINYNQDISEKNNLHNNADIKIPSKLLIKDDEDQLLASINEVTLNFAGKSLVFNNQNTLKNKELKKNSSINCDENKFHQFTFNKDSIFLTEDFNSNTYVRKVINIASNKIIKNKIIRLQNKLEEIDEQKREKRLKILIIAASAFLLSFIIIFRNWIWFFIYILFLTHI